MFATSLKQLAVVLLPAVLASLPLLFMLAWLYGAYGHVLPERPDEVRRGTGPQGYRASLRLPQTASVDTVAVGGAPLLRVQDGTGRVIEERPMSAPVTSLHKEQWWNVLIDNPLGPLASASPPELVETELPRPAELPIGPWWLSTRGFFFFTTLV